MYSSKSVHLATVELCTSCSQKADREGLSLKSEMNFISVGEDKKHLFLLVWMDSTSSCYSLNSFFFKWRCCSLVLLKSLWQKQVLTTHLSWNHLWGYNLCNALKHTLTMNRTKYRQSQSTYLSVTVCIHVRSILPSLFHGTEPLGHRAGAQTPWQN